MVLGFTIYGGTVSTLIISNDLTSAQFATMQYIIDTFDDKEFTLMASPVYSWILSDVYGHENVFLDYGDAIFYEPKTKYQYLVVDNHFLLDQNRDEKLVELLKNAESVKSFSLNDQPNSDVFPFQSFKVTTEGNFIDIKTNKIESWP